MTPERIAQILRLSVAALAEGLEQVLDVLKSSDERARIAEGERDALARGKRLAECDRESHYGALNNAIKVLMEEFFRLSPQGDLPNVNSAGGQLAQCVESVLAEYRARLAALTEERDRLKEELDTANMIVAADDELASSRSRERNAAQEETWRCFHCGFETTNRKEAMGHFGDVDEGFPVCITWKDLDADGKLSEYQNALANGLVEFEENAKLRTKIEGLEYRVEGQLSEIHSFAPFRKCDSIHQVFHVYDSMEGRALAAEARLAAQPEGVPEGMRLVKIHGQAIKTVTEKQFAVSELEPIPPSPVPEEAPPLCPKCGTQGCEECNPHAPEEAPGQFTDRERFEWYFGLSDKKHFLETYMHGVNDGWTPEQWRSKIDSAMLQSGLKPSPVAEREKVTLNELVNAYQRGYQQLDSGETNRSAQESGILAAVEALQGKALAG